MSGRHMLIAIAFISAITLGYCGCDDGNPSSNRPAKRPYKTLPWPGRMSFRVTPTGCGLCAVRENGGLDCWRWQDADFIQSPLVVMPDNIGVAVSGRIYLVKTYAPGKESPLVLGSFDSSEEMGRWDPPDGWSFSQCGFNRGGGLAIVTAVARQAVHDEYPMRVGLLDTASRKLRWVYELSDHGAGSVRQVTVSDDGKYIAVGGWDNKLLMIDAVGGKELWRERPPMVNSPGYACFSADGSVVYSADSGGDGVFEYDTVTGKVNWTCSAPGAMRISTLAVSPDGAWLAVGSGPGGLVHLFDLKAKNGRPVVLNHGGSTILAISFSPDSQHVATMTPGVIKLWHVGPSVPGN